MLSVTGDERIELPPKVLETPIIPFDQSPIFYKNDAFDTSFIILYDFFAKINSTFALFCTFKTSYRLSDFFGQALDLLVTVSSTCYHASTSALSTL